MDIFGLYVNLMDSIKVYTNTVTQGPKKLSCLPTQGAWNSFEFQFFYQKQKLSQIFQTFKADVKFMELAS